MGVLRRRLGALVAIAALALTPAVRVACLALCAAPLDARQAVDTARPGDPQPTAAAHAHHHAPVAAPSADARMASARATPDTRCDSERDRCCADRAGIVPLPAARAVADDAVPTPPVPRLAMAGRDARAFDTRPLIRVAPPGPLPASLPLRI